MKKLILFDIDGTLIHTGGAGTRSMNKAFSDLFGIHDAFRNYSMAGKTDRQIMRDGLNIHGLRLDGNVNLLVEKYLDSLRNEIDNPHRKYQPGIIELLERLSSDGFALGLLTGNLEEGARIKLEPFGLNKYFPAGAFGSDHEDRDRLLPIAIRTFSQRGLAVRPVDCIVIGDTPRDVRCAKIHGARCLAVATGPYSLKDLLETDADAVFSTLGDTGKCLHFIKNCC